MDGFLKTLLLVCAIILTFGLAYRFTYALLLLLRDLLLWLRIRLENKPRGKKV